MKILSTILLSCLIMAGTGVAMAGVPTVEQRHAPTDVMKRHSCDVIEIDGKTYKASHSAANAPKRLPVSNVIFEPQGEKRFYFKDSGGLYYYIMQTYAYDDRNVYLETVWGPDDKVYIKDILSPIHLLDSYVEGTVSGNTITVPMNQTVAYNANAGYGMNLVVMKAKFTSDSFSLEYEPSIQSVTYTIAEDGSLTLNIPGSNYDGTGFPDYVLAYAYTDDNSWSDYCDYYQTFRNFGYELNAMSEGVPQSHYVSQSYIYDYYSESFVKTEGIVNVAREGNTMYLQGLCQALPEAVVKAEINGNTATIFQNQFVGTWDDTYYIFTKVFEDNALYDPSDPDSYKFDMAPANATFDLVIDDAEGTIKSESTGYLVFNGDPDRIISLDIYSSYSMDYTESIGGIPSNPEIIEYTEEYALDFGMSDFYFNFNPVLTDGSLLDTRYLYYTVYVDGKPIEFESSKGFNLCGELENRYEGFPGKSVYVPVSFDNYYDLNHIYGYYYVGIYEMYLETIGVQMAYMYDGKTTYSDIVTYNVATEEITTAPGTPETPDTPGGNAGVTALDVDVTVEYYTLQGVRLATPSAGICIRKTVGPQGIKTEKVIYK